MSDQRFEDFDLIFVRVGDMYQPRAVSFFAGEAVGLPFPAPELPVETEGGAFEPAAAQSIGTRLFEAAFSGEVRQAFLRSRGYAGEREGGVRLRLRLSRAPELAALPWELLYSPSERSFLSLRVPIVRFVEAPTAQISREPDGPLRVLTVLIPLSSLPNAEQEVRELQRTLETSIPRDQLVLDSLTTPTPEALYQHLRRDDVHVLHFAGHGAYERAGATGMRFGFDRDRSREFGEIAEVLRDHPVDLVVLNAARSSAPARSVESLIRDGISTVVDLPLHQTTGVRFNTELYRGLAEGTTLDTAVSNARQRLYRGGDAGSDWGVPTVYTSLPTGHSFGISETGGIREATRGAFVSYGSPVRGLGGGEAVEAEDGLPPPPPPPSSTPAIPPPPRQRFLQGRFPPRVRLTDSATLQVRIALSTGTERSAPLRELAVPAEGLDAVLVLYAEGFEAPEGDRRPVKIPASSDSDWVPFPLKAVRSGTHRLEITAYTRDGAFLGSLGLEVTVDERFPTSESRDHQQPLRRRLAEDEVTLRIRYDTGNKIYKFQLIDGSILPPDEVPSSPLLATPADAVENLIRDLNAIAQGQSKFTAEQTRTWLRNKGIDLWNKFIPQELQRQFWNLQGRIKKIMIISDLQGDPVPWELLYPFKPGTSNDGGFFAEQFLLSRWVSPADPPAPRLHLASAAFVEPATGSPLPRAEQEIQEIRDLLSQQGITTGDPIRDLTSLLDLLKAGGFNLLHFACHNSYTSAEISMGGSPFQPVFLNEHQKQYVETAPLVFINACRSDVQVPRYTGLEGWARAFVDAGAGAFIGTLWVVRDETAAQFAEELYRNLLKPKPAAEAMTLGEALIEARRAVRDVPGDPTWLAYTLYGDTAATLA